MDGFDIDITALNKLEVRIGQAAKKVPEQARQVTRKTANDVERDAKTFCPVDTGFLRNSIGVDMAGNAYYTEAVIGPTADYGPYVEFGTSRMAPSAFMGPAFDRHSGEYVQAMEKITNLDL